MMFCVMGQIFVYSIISGLALVTMYLIYKITLASQNQHSYNRAALLLIYAVALVAPLLPALPPLIITFHNEPVYIDIGTPESAIVGINDTGVSLVPKILVGIYFAGVVVMAVMTIVSMVRLFTVIHRGRKIEYDGLKVILLDSEKYAPFSWRNYVVMSQTDFDESRNVILAHERCHISSLHYIDLLVAQAVIVFQWYNPAAWLMREELRLVHEYQADEAVSMSGFNLRQYQTLLIKKAVGSRFRSLANSLNHSNLKKRITMMYKSKSSLGGRLRALALVPAALIAVAAVSIPSVASALDSVSQAYAGDKVTNNESISQDVSYEKIIITAADPASLGPVEKTTELDKEPQYPGGEMAMMEYLMRNLKYPEKAIEAGKQGRVEVTFIVDEKGNVTSPEVKKSVDESLDAEAIRVVKDMKFTPGRSKGKPVACTFTLPIVFRLPKSK